MPVFPSLQKDLHTDVLIIGGGMTGILCAYRLAKAGVDYALIEADRICNGVTRNTTAKITSQHGLIYHKLLRMHGSSIARAYYKANEAAIRAYEDLAGSVDCDFERQDNYIYCVDSLKPLEAERAALARLGIPADLVKETALPFPVVGAIRFRNQAQFNPMKLVCELVKGLHIYENTTAREFVGNTVITDHGKITASKIIVATHFPILNKHGGYFLKLFQQRSYVLAVRNEVQPDGMYLGEAKDGISLRSYGDLLLIGGSSHRTGKKSRGWEGLETFAKTHYPKAQEISRWATQDCISLDGMPYIGQYSKRTPHLFVATGFNKWGMTSSMVAAMILCDLVQGKHNAYAFAFSPQRRMLRWQLLCNLAESTVNLLTPTTPRCPHMGCALKWNAREHSWDCPCHGSRFTAKGKLLDNPSTGDAKTDL